MSFKRLPTDKTVLTELKIQLADTHTRNKLTKDSIAARITQEIGVHTGDETVTPTQPLIITDIKSVIYVRAWGPIKLRIAYDATAVQEVPCSGLFLMYGELSSIEIRSAIDEQLRLSYVYA